MNLPLLLTRAEIMVRLGQIFPNGSTELRGFVTRELAASTVFSMLYVGAIEGNDVFLAPKHVYRMSDDQARLTSDAHRVAYDVEVMKPGSVPRGKAWYADNSREPIRDETLRQGLVAVGAVIENKKVPTTSSKGRYRLKGDFANLFDPRLVGDQLGAEMAAWRKKHLRQAALLKVELLRSGAAGDAADVVVTCPNGDSRRLAPGPSSVITKYVVEHFAPRFLEKPAVVWISESKKKVTLKDDMLVKSLGILIDAAVVLPDVILADVYDDGPLVVFVEVVATDGPISEGRRVALRGLVPKLADEDVAFVTAYMERDGPLKRNLAQLAPNTFVWIASEEDNLIGLFATSAERRRHLHSFIHR